MTSKRSSKQHSRIVRVSPLFEAVAKEKMVQLKKNGCNMGFTDTTHVIAEQLKQIELAEASRERRKRVYVIKYRF